MQPSKSKQDRDERVLILAPTGRDAELTAYFLREESVTAEVCVTVQELCDKMLAGAGLSFLTGEALTAEAMRCLIDALSQQPAWSDIPIVILTSGGGDTPANAEALSILSQKGNVTLIERPVRVMTLLSMMKAGLRARSRQYDVRDHLASEIRAKQELAESEQRLRIALDAAQLGAWQINFTSGKLECTPLCKANFGLSPDADLNYEKLLSLIHPDDRELVKTAIRHAVTEHDLYRAEYRAVWTDQSIHWILASGRANYGTDGTAFNMVGVTLDITERKHHEQEREALLSQAQEANRLKDEFLATVSHELRTPLNAVLGWTHLLRSNNLDQDARARALETIERNARSQQQLIEDLLDVSRIITGKLLLDIRPVEPHVFIDATIEAVRPAATAKEITIQKSIQPDVGTIVGDPARLQQVVWNLLSNAIKFTPRGGKVEVSLERLGAEVELRISDNGQGISRKFVPFVFERFRQEDMKTTRVHGGLGLGLAIVRQLVELHGGTVGLHSEGEGKGATFFVRLPSLPIYQKARAANDKSRPTPSLGQQLDCADNLIGVRVLAVDDEPDTCELLRTSLSQCGAEVTVAQSAAEALNLLSQVTPDVLISDIGMPGQDGYELISKVRALSPNEGGRVPALALTAYARAEDRLLALRAGFQMHLAKPIELTELAAIVASLAERVRKQHV